MIEWVRVSSTAISKIGYDKERKQLHITFIKSGDYTFCRVPESLFKRFCSAPSKGAFYHNHIEGNYHC